MARSLYNLIGSRRHNDSARDNWMIAIEGVVVENNDPERMHRIKCTIPVIDESMVFDDWIPAMTPWCGAPGYGPVNPPALNSEVLLFGRLGEPDILFYLSRYNEDHLSPEEFTDGSRGLKTDTAYKLLADLFIEIISKQTILIKATEQADVRAAVVRLMGDESEGVRVEPSKLGFLGASPIPRQSLPAPATDLGSCITLANAIRSMLIQFGLAE